MPYISFSSLDDCYCLFLETEFWLGEPHSLTQGNGFHALQLTDSLNKTVRTLTISGSKVLLVSVKCCNLTCTLIADGPCSSAGKLSHSWV